jgi:hypothetical protein
MPPPLPLKLRSAEVMVIYDGVTLEFNRRPTEDEVTALAHNIEVWLDNEAEETTSLASLKKQRI